MRVMERDLCERSFPYGALTIHSLSIRLRLEQEMLLPPYKGSTYRGLLGHALIRAYCPLRQEACAECRRRDACPYPNLFKPHVLHPAGGVPAPYLVDPSFDQRTRFQRGDEVTFVLRLFGAALRWLPFVLAALCKAGDRGALGSRRSRFAMVEPSPPDDATEPSAWGVSAPDGLQSARAEDLQGGNLAIGAVRVVTPLKLREGGAIQGEVRGDTFLKAVERRLRALYRFHGQDTEERPKAWEELPFLRLGRSDLRWVVLERHSYTHADPMNIGGWVGTLAVEEHNAQAASLLQVGQWTHVGKNTVYGCGKYRILGQGGGENGAGEGARGRQ